MATAITVSAVGEGEGEARQIPAVKNGVYPATIARVEDAQYPNYDDPSEMDSFYLVVWSLEGVKDENTGKDAELVQFVRIPPKAASGEFLSKKSNLYLLMSALGIPFGEKNYTIEPDAWVGLASQLIVKNELKQKGKYAGQTLPKIVDLMPYDLEDAPSSNGHKETPIDPDSLPWEGEGENETVPPTPAHQKLLKALNDAYGSKVSRKMLFLEENGAEGADVLKAVCSLHDNKAQALAIKLQKGGE